MFRKKHLEIKLAAAPKAEKQTTPTPGPRLTDSELETAKVAVVAGLAMLLAKTVVECGTEIAIAGIQAK